MPDEEKQGTDEQRTESSETPDTPREEKKGGDEERRFTQADIDRAVRDRLARERSKAKPEKKDAPKKTEDDRLASLEKQLEEERLRRRFDKQAARRGFDDEQSDRLFSLYKVEQPDDDGTWFEGWSKTVKGDTDNQQQGDKAKAEPPEPQRREQAMPNEGSPRKVDEIESGGLVDVFALSDEDITRLGPAKVRDLFEQVLAAGAARDGAPMLPRALRQKG